MPPVLHGQAEAGGHRRPRGPVPAPVRPDPAQVLNPDQLERWLADYGRAWETKDPDAAVALFTEDATYQETPFAEAMRGRDAIHAYWSEVEPTQDDISFEHTILSVGGGRAFVHWTTSLTWKPNGQRMRLDGIFLLNFDASGRCRSLREWWHADPPFPD